MSLVFNASNVCPPWPVITRINMTIFLPNFKRECFLAGYQLFNQFNTSEVSLIVVYLGVGGNKFENSFMN